MDIWWVNHHALLPTQGGGTRHFDISRELVARGHRVTVWASSRNHGTGQEDREHQGWQPVIEEIEGVRWVWLKTTPYFGNGIRRALNQLCFAFVFLWAAGKLGRQWSKPEVIVGSSVHPVAAFVSWVLARWWGLTSITEIRDIWPEALLAVGIPRYHPGVLFYHVLVKTLYRCTDAIITLLPTSIEHFVSHGCPRENIYWVPNGTAMELKERSPLNQPFRAMYLGTFGVGYALETLIQAAAILEEREAGINLVLKGQGPYRPVLEELIEDLKLSSITLEEAIPKTEVPAALAACDALIFHLPPSPVFQWGISSNKLFDYMASGRPVIFACVAANNPVEEANSGLTIAPEEPEQLAESLIQLAQLTEEERLTMGRRGQQFIRENHTIRELAHRFETAVSETLARTQ